MSFKVMDAVNLAVTQDEFTEVIERVCEAMNLEFIEQKQAESGVIVLRDKRNFFSSPWHWQYMIRLFPRQAGITVVVEPIPRGYIWVYKIDWIYKAYMVTSLLKAFGKE